MRDLPSLLRNLLSLTRRLCILGSFDAAVIATLDLEKGVGLASSAELRLLLLQYLVSLMWIVLFWDDVLWAVPTKLASLASEPAVIQHSISLFPAGHSRSDPPPGLADFLRYLLLYHNNKNQIIGDLAEEFQDEIVPAFGLRAARLWYWKKTLSVIIERNPIARRLLIGGGLVKAGEVIWRTFAD